MPSHTSRQEITAAELNEAEEAKVEDGGQASCVAEASPQMGCLRLT